MSDETELHLSLSAAKDLESPERIADLTWQRAIELLHRQEGMGDYLPDGIYAVDPRNQEATLFNRSRARRPHDNKANRSQEASPACIICDGKTTSIIDRAELAEGFTFINENLFPILYPEGASTEHAGLTGELGSRSFGLHFVQWTSSYHAHDWPALNTDDRVVVLDRLAALEERLLELPDFPADERYVSIIKNSGRLVGGSLSHPHQQIGLSNAMPRRVRENRDFFDRTGRTFSAFMLEHTIPELTVARLDTGRLVVPYFMRRPYNLLYLLENTEPSHLWETTETERSDLGTALATGMRLAEEALRIVGREEAYNIVFHTGPGTGLYLEFLPRTQEDGGFEQLGLSACQASPLEVAQHMRERL